MIKTIEYAERVETIGGYMETYRNEDGDQVVALCNTLRGEDARLTFTQSEIAEIIELVKRGGWVDGEEDTGDSSGFGLHTDMILGENPDMLRQD